MFPLYPVLHELWYVEFTFEMLNEKLWLLNFGIPNKNDYLVVGSFTNFLKIFSE